MWKRTVHFGMRLRKGLRQMIDKTFQVRGQEIHVKMQGDVSLPTVVLLHGFTGTSSTWSEVARLLKGEFRVIAIDLIGHGKTTVPNEPGRYVMVEQIKDLEALFDEMKLQYFHLIGYSMGGRIALAYTKAYPNRVLSLLLESASPGLKTEQERIERKKADALLANRIQKEGILNFVDFWESIPLFESQKKLSIKQRDAVRGERLAQSELGLANSLRGIGTGSQPSLWEDLSSIVIPVLLITGEIDRKFVFIAREMKEMFPNATHKSINGAGHAIHVEKPTLFATMVKEHIKGVTNIEEVK